jgi:hypothetical protein
VLERGTIVQTGVKACRCVRLASAPSACIPKLRGQQHGTGSGELNVWRIAAQAGKPTPAPTPTPGLAWPGLGIVMGMGAWGHALELGPGRRHPKAPPRHTTHPNCLSAASLPQRLLAHNSSISPSIHCSVLLPLPSPLLQLRAPPCASPPSPS